MSRAVAQAFTALRVRLYRALNGRVVARGPGGVPLALLTTTGRRSDRAHTVPVGYVRHGQDLLISPGGTSAPLPGWLHNRPTRAHAHIQLHDQHLSVQAEEPEASEQERPWHATFAARPTCRLAERSGQGNTESRTPLVIRPRVRPAEANPTL